MTTLAHPVWCARAYRCTAHYPGGEHLSPPWTFLGRRVATVVSLAQRAAELTPRVEIRLRVRLGSPDPATQACQIRELLTLLNTTVGEAIQ